MIYDLCNKEGSWVEWRQLIRCGNPYRTSEVEEEVQQD